MVAVDLGVPRCCRSMMVPMKKAQNEGVRGMSYVPVFGIGVAMCSLLFAAISFASRGSVPQLHFKVTFVPGFTCGLFWNIANGEECITRVRTPQHCHDKLLLSWLLPVGSLLASLSPLGQTAG